MKEYKISSTMFYVVAVLFYLAGIMSFLGGNNKSIGVMWLCLGSAFLCFGSVFLNKAKETDAGEEDHSEEKIQETGKEEEQREK